MMTPRFETSNLGWVCFLEMGKTRKKQIGGALWGAEISVSLDISGVTP